MEFGVANLLISPILGQAVTRALDRFKRDKILKRDYATHINTLQRNISRIERYQDATILDDEIISNWYTDLKDLMYAAVDALDIYARAENTKDAGLSAKLWDILFTLSAHSVAKNSSLSILRAIEIINEKTTTLLAERSKDERLESIASMLKDYPKLRPTPTSLPYDDYMMFGRDDIRDHIIMTLNVYNNDLTSEKLRVLPIVGTGGIGKTMLVRSIYSSEMNNFDLSGWVHDSSEEFDVKTLFTRILTRFGKEIYEIAPDDLENLTTSLVKELDGKRFLLVLDGTWNKVHSRWEEFLTPLQRGKNGSWLIITTRDKNVVEAIPKSSKVQIEPEIQLSGLNEKVLWEIVKQHALFDMEIQSDAREKLEEKGEKICKKLAEIGSPLAAKTMGLALGANLSERHWENIYECDLGDSLNSKKDNDLIPSQTISFLHLPRDAKSCLRYCSLFQLDDKVDEQQLVYQWLAHDYLRVEDKESAEAAAAPVIRNLQSMPLFERSTSQSDYTPTYKMHGLYHNTLRDSGRDEYLQIAEDRNIVDNIQKQSPRHLCISSNRKFSDVLPEKSEDRKKLRTLIFMSKTGTLEVKSSTLGECFEELKCLRVLILHGLKTEKLPNRINKLNHLRYLDLSHSHCSRFPSNPIENLWSSIGELYYLQALTLSGFVLRDISEGMRHLSRLSRLRFLDLSSNPMQTLPETITVLSDLRVLRLRCCNKLRTLPNGIGELKRLECLNLYLCCSIEVLPSALGFLSHLTVLELRSCKSLQELPDELSNLKKLKQFYADPRLMDKIHDIGKFISLEHLQTFSVQESGRKIDQLTNLNMLRGELSITNLDLVEPTEAQGAKLECKTKLTMLTLIWDAERTRDLRDEEDTLEYLRPCKQLRGLTIHNYMGSKLPRWLTGQHLCCLQRLSLHGLKNIVKLDVRSTGISTSAAREMGDYKQVKLCKMFTFLHQIELVSLPKLSEWNGIDENREQVFPRLRNVTVSGCPELKCIPDIPSSLEDISLKDCPNLVELTVACDCEKFKPKFNLTPLKKLKLRDCKNLCSLPKELISFTSLKTLEIKQCNGMECLPEQFHELIRRLQKLSITDCKDLTVLSKPDLSEEWESLSLINCPTLSRLSVEHNPNQRRPLLELIIQDCKGLPIDVISSYLEALHSLRRLVISNCGGNLSNSIVKKVLLEHLQESPDSRPGTLSHCEISSAALELRYYKWDEGGKNAETNGLASIEWKDESKEQFSGSCTCRTVVEEMLKGIPSQCVKILHLGGVHDVEAIEGELEKGICKLSLLEELSISNCRDLKNLPFDKMDENLRKLKTVRITSCEGLPQKLDRNYDWEYKYTSGIKCHRRRTKHYKKCISSLSQQISLP